MNPDCDVEIKSASVPDETSDANQKTVDTEKCMTAPESKEISAVLVRVVTLLTAFIWCICSNSAAAQGNACSEATRTETHRQRPPMPTAYSGSRDASRCMTDARTYTRMGRKLDAIDAALQAAKLVPTFDEAPLLVARNLMDLGRWDDALKYCNTAINLSGASEETLATQVAIYFRAERPEAIPAAQAYLAKFPTGRYNEVVRLQLDEARQFRTADTSAPRKLNSYIKESTASGKYRWQASSMPLKVFIESRGGSTSHEFEECVYKAFQHWQTSSHGLVSFQYVPDRTKADIECHWNQRSDGNIATATAPGSRLIDFVCGPKQEEGYAEVNLGRGCILHAHIFLREPDDRPEAAKMVQLSALHQIGHTLGLLEHSDDGADILGKLANRQRYQNLFTAQITKRDGNTIASLYRQSPQDYNLETRYSMDLDRPDGFGYLQYPTIDELLGYGSPLKVSTAVTDSQSGPKPRSKAMALYQQAEARWVEDDPVGAQKLARLAAAADKKWYKPHLLLSLILKRTGDLNRAYEESVAAVLLEPNDQEVWLRCAGLLLKCNRFDEVLQIGNDFRQRFPSASEENQREMMLAMSAAVQRIALQNSNSASHDYLSLATTQGHYRWAVPHAPLKVFIADGTGSPLYNPEFKNRLITALTQWQQASNGLINWQFVTDPSQADVECHWTDCRTKPADKDQSGIMVNFEPGNRLRGTITHGWISLEMWSKRSKKKLAPDAIQLQALQEVGNVLGILGRSNSVADVMYQYAGTDVTELIISNQDKRTLQLLYTDRGHQVSSRPY